MKNSWIVQLLAGLATLLLAGWIVHKTSWVDVEEETPAKGAASTDPYYSFKKIAAASGTTLVERSALQPMPPREATMFLASRFWDVFPENDAALQRWVADGGHLVVLGSQVSDTQLRWAPSTFVRHVKARHAAGNDGDDDDDSHDAASKAPPKPLGGLLPGAEAPVCESFVESEGSPPAFEPARTYSRCLRPTLRTACVDPALHRNPNARPIWELGNDDRSYAMRVAVGRGSVTTVADCLPLNNSSVLLGDHALIDAAVLGMKPGATLWIVDDESGERLPLWLWHNARAPLLLTLAGIALALWRLVVRFGPRVAPPVQARRSMGEQVRGTGQFIAERDPQALHAATRKAFDDAARPRIEGYADLDDEARAAALAAQLAPGLTLDAAALVSALSSIPRAHPAQWVAAIDTIEQARRALLRAGAAPPSAASSGSSGAAAATSSRP